ncbi:winged helix DNA-binding domain-containing protein [Kibdelosporangium philippinense]|uniref:Winged helix DNA-binding domain-containing protein n=1 Tax=Kibdelosporangium philippinense TaxID=211113 RepID=A0ABS8Z5L6_9PSEU|nr:crosslink repair DNA glycosylase YcaQ family protein [Kibdelosporangium philippinense]MCE7002319.1 winged helix DNA-binding domain-containing protein [Kibdelosporangium philippinense]
MLSDRELTVAYLARQMLLERLDRPVGRAVQALGALQAQYSPSPYVALFARLASFDAGQLESALKRGSVVKSTLMRGTLHLEGI